MGAGRIVDFSKGNQIPEVKRLSHTNSEARRVQVMDKSQSGEPMPVEIRHHETITVEGEGNIRLKKDGSPDLRFRNAPTNAEWEKIKRGNWEEK